MPSLEHQDQINGFIKLAILLNITDKIIIISFFSVSFPVAFYHIVTFRQSNQSQALKLHIKTTYTYT